jgi:general secretion pathway protein D
MQTLKAFTISIVLAVIIGLTPGNTVAQQESSVPPSETKAKPVEVVKNDGIKVKLNFQDAPLQTVLEYLSDAAGLTIISNEPIYDSRITVISRQPISLADAVSLINSILKERDLTAILMGKTLKVVTLAKAKTENIPVFSGQDPDDVVPSDDVVHYVVPVSHVTAAALKENLKALLPEYASIEANEDGNALIITDTTANIKRLMQIIKALDTHMATVAEIRVFRLINTDATSAANLINTMFKQQQSGTSSQQGSRNPMEMMIQGMRGRGPGGRGGPGSETENQSQGSGSVNVQVVAAADDRTNSIVIRGPADALDVVASMVKQLEDTTAKVAGVKIFQLRYADALNTAEMINQLFGQEQTSSQNQQGGGFGPMMFRGPGGGAQQTQQNEETGSAARVAAAADSQTNTVVVTGPDNLLEIVADVVKNLDTQLPNVADVKVFHLEYADAQDTADLINEVFGQSRTSSQTTRSSNRQNQQILFMRGGPGGFGGPQQQTTTSGGGSISDVAIIASADSRTNSVVVSGPAETLQIVAQVIKDLDENPAAERRIFVYALKNANATNLMTILNNLFQEMASLNQQVTGSRSSTTGGQRNTSGGMASGGMGGQAAGGISSSSTSSSSDTLSEETYFEADPNTNSLLVMTSSKNYDKIKPTIDELDKPVGQVLIKVLFAEVSYSDSVDLGTEFSILNLRSGGGSTDTTGIFGKPTTMTTEGGATKPTGLSVRTLQGDLDLTLRALQETGKLNVLSRPYVLTRNNQTATITVAEEVPIATGTTSSGSIGSTTTYEYRNDIGIVLEVTPSINPDGVVNMTVSPKITTRTGETVQIAENLNPVVFATRSATTRVAVLDGQTIVIGGLIEDQLKDTTKKVPLLGDIPIAGLLFKRTVKEKSKTELLIFLTPCVAREPGSLIPISEAERARSNLNFDSEDADLFKKHMDAMENTDTKINEP